MSDYRDYQHALQVYRERLAIWGPFHKSVIQARKDCERLAMERV